MIYMKESYVYSIPCSEEGTRWLPRPDPCGTNVMRQCQVTVSAVTTFFYVCSRSTRAQVCEGCIKESIAEMQAWIGEEE